MQSRLTIHYHLPILPPAQPEVEAYSQEIAALQTRFGGVQSFSNPNFLNPNQHLPQALRRRLPLLRVPRLLFGYHQPRRLRQIDQAVDLHQFYNPDPFPYPILRTLQKPVVYVLSGGAGTVRPNVDFFNAMSAVAVYDQRSVDQLQEWGITNAVYVKSGIDTKKFTHAPLAAPADTNSEADPTVHLLMASAPWSDKQFASKGIDALLAAARELPDLHLTFLWRGVLYSEMIQRVVAFGLQDRVCVINELVNVNEILATVHASVVLATHSNIVKAYPHSLLDSLAAGKPVLVSSALALADYVAERDVGVVIDTVNVDAVVAGVRELVDRYAALADNAVTFGQQDFSQEAMIDSYEEVYARLLE